MMLTSSVNKTHQLVPVYDSANVSPKPVLPDLIRLYYACYALPRCLICDTEQNCWGCLISHSQQFFLGQLQPLVNLQTVIGLRI